MFVWGLLVSCFAIANGASLSGRIIGGSTAPDHKYPYLVSLRLRYPGQQDFHRCGAAILNEHWLLTAAHCVDSSVSIKRLYAVAGTNYLSEEGEEYKVWFTILHPKYTNGRHDDIALVRIVGSIEFNEHVQPVQLPSENIKEFSSPAAFAGWARTKYNASQWTGSSNELQEIPLTIISNDICDKTLPGTTITEDHICTFTVRGEGTCLGDSGSPLVVDGVQVGVDSMAILCARGYPDVFTRVANYVDWIEEVQEKYATVIPH